jgi:hypothetical protein
MEERRWLGDIAIGKIKIRWRATLSLVTDQASHSRKREKRRKGGSNFQ